MGISSVSILAREGISLPKGGGKRRCTVLSNTEEEET